MVVRPAADVARKALAQLREEIYEILADKQPEEKARAAHGDVRRHQGCSIESIRKIQKSSLMPGTRAA